MPSPLKHGVGHALAGAVGLGDRGQDDLDGSDTVERVATLRVLAVLGLVGVEELDAGAAGLDELVLGRARRRSGTCPSDSGSFSMSG